MSYKIQAVKEVAAEIKKAGFRVFIAKSGSYGFYTDAQGSKVVSFQYDLCGVKFSGNYKSKTCGTGWGMDSVFEFTAEAFNKMFEAFPPRWATNGEQVKPTTLEQHLKTYQASSQYTEVVAEVETIHYGMTEAQARRKAGSSGSFEGRLPLCGNGSYHVQVTSDADSVTCEACKVVLKTRPTYL